MGMVRLLDAARRNHGTATRSGNEGRLPHYLVSAGLVCVSCTLALVGGLYGQGRDQRQEKLNQFGQKVLAFLGRGDKENLATEPTEKHEDTRLIILGDLGG